MYQHAKMLTTEHAGTNQAAADVLLPVELKFEMISCCHHVLGVFKYSPKCFVVRSALRCFRELPSSLLKF